jgi:RND family efflux transporter MFP subunit
MRTQTSWVLRYWWIGGLLLVALVVGGSYGVMHVLSAVPAAMQDDPDEPQGNEGQDILTVEVVSPQPGGMDRTTTQPCTVQAFESVPIYAAVSGYLKTLHGLDIGDPVKKGDIVAEIEVPELRAQLKLHQAAVKRANEKVHQMEALKKVYQADEVASKAAVKQASAAAETSKTMLKFHKRRFERLNKLGEKGIIDADVVDEQHQRYEAAEQAVNAALESVIAAEARMAAVGAKILQGDADIAEASAAVEVAQAEEQRTQELVNFASITAPFDGRITERNVDVKHFIRAATINANQPPLLVVQRVDKVRVIVMVPDRDVMVTKVGDEAVVEIDGITDEVFKGTVAKKADSEDSKSRSMRVEIWLDNPKGKLNHGMYGRATITLEKATNVLALPTTCVFGLNESKTKGQVYIVRNKRAVLTPVTVVGENDTNIGVVGLNSNDQVIVHPNLVTANNMEVTVASSAKKKKSSKR